MSGKDPNRSTGYYLFNCVLNEGRQSWVFDMPKVTEFFAKLVYVNQLYGVRPELV